MSHNLALTLSYVPASGASPVILAEICDAGLTKRAAHVALTHAEERARGLARKGDRVVAWDAALEAARLSELLNVLIPARGVAV